MSLTAVDCDAEVVRFGAIVQLVLAMVYRVEQGAQGEVSDLLWGPDPSTVDGLRAGSPSRWWYRL